MLAGELNDRIDAVDFRSGFLLVPLPPGKRCICNRNRGDEDRRGVDLPDVTLVRIPLNDVKQAVSEHNIGWSLHEQFCVNCSPHCPMPLHKLPLVPEQLSIGPCGTDSGKALTRVVVPFLPTVSFGRPIADSLRRDDSKTSQIKSVTPMIPANDIGWHPLDVA